MQKTILTVLSLAWTCAASAQIVTPVSLVDSIVDIHDVGGSNFNDELVLFRSDGTYQDIAVTSHFSGGGTPTSSPMSGTYSYAVSIGTGWQGPETVGTVTWTNGTASRPALQLYFQSAHDGQPGVSGPGVLSSFGIYPANSLTGAVNVSNNSWVSGAHPTTPGFVIQGTASHWVLIRGVGPSLAQFAVPSPVAQPLMTFQIGNWTSVNLQTVSSNNGETVTQTISPWASDPNLVPGLQAIFDIAGAFQLLEGSSDCAALILLPPGAYVVQGSDPGADGELLTEVYVLPFGS